MSNKPIDAAQQEARDVIEKTHKQNKKDFWTWVANTKLGLLVKGLAIFYAGAAALILSVLAALVGHTGSIELDMWVRWVVSLAAAPIFVMAAYRLGSFIIKAAK